MNFNFLIYTPNLISSRPHRWTDRQGHMNNNDTYVLDSCPLQLMEDLVFPVKFFSPCASRCVKLVPLTLWRALPLLHIALGLRSVLLLPELRAGSAAASPGNTGVEDHQVPQIILVCDSQNLYPDLSFYLVLRAGNLCKSSLEMWVPAPRRIRIPQWVVENVDC